MVQRRPLDGDGEGNPGRRLVNVDEAARYLGVKRRKMYSLMASEEIPSVLIPPRTRRLDIRDLDKFIEDNRKEAI